MQRNTALALVTALALAGCGGNDNDDGLAPSTLSAAQACTSLSGKTIAGAQITGTKLQEAAGSVPAHCSVSATIAPALNFEMRIPNAWNRKLHYGGGGGFNGFIQSVFDASVGGGSDTDNHGLNLAALQQGYINIASDSGHKGKIPGAEAIDGSWVPGNPLAERLYAGESVPTVMAAAREIVRTAFGSTPTLSYFEGCSNGGREALVSAQRYPDLFDGIISRAPAKDFAATVGAFQANMRVTIANPTLNFTPAKVTLLANAVLGACDAQDGVVDGLASNPAACTFTAATARATLRCAGGADTGNNCLSDAQLAVVDTVNSAQTFAGRYTTLGSPLTGAESAAGNWDAWLFGGIQFAFQYGGISGFLQKDPATQPVPPSDASAFATLSYDFNAAANAAAIQAFSTAVDANNADLRPFRDSGGKLLLWHGGSDPALSVRNTTKYYQDVVSTLGGQGNADAFTRYYVAPGVNHCRGGPGADKSDLLAALDAWVVHGRAPGALTATKSATATSTAFTRPLCAWPQYPRYTGPAGDAAATRVASSYTCTTP